MSAQLSWVELLCYSDDFVRIGNRGVVIWPDVSKPYMLELWEDHNGARWCQFLDAGDSTPQTSILPFPIRHT